MSKGPKTETINKDRLLSPGPGQYDANSFVGKDRTPIATFSKTKRNSLITKEDSAKLGPGNYDPNPKKGTPCFTFGTKLSQKIKTDVPGPGNYDPDMSKVKDKVKGVSMGKS